MLQQVSINLSRKFTETSDEVFEKLPSSPGDDLEEVDTLKETEHETGNVATSVELVKTPLDAFEDASKVEQLNRLFRNCVLWWTLVSTESF